MFVRREESWLVGSQVEGRETHLESCQSGYEAHGGGRSAGMLMILRSTSDRMDRLS